MLLFPAKPLFPKAFLAAIVVLAGIAGCVTLPPAAPVGDGFVISGRLSIRTPTDGFSSSFRWQHSAPNFDIELWGAMGQGRSRLVGAADAVTVYAADGEVYHEPDLAAATRRWLGVAVPVPALTHWVLGAAAPGMPIDAETRDASGDLVALSQAAWSLEFSSYRDGSGRRLPGRIVANGADVRVILLPREWQFGDGSL